MTLLRISLALAATSSLIGACNTPQRESPAYGAPPLKELAAKSGLMIGSAIDPKFLFTDPIYRRFVQREFSVLTPENAFKFKALVPKQGVYDFKVADKIVQFARSHGILIRGHTLLWHNPSALPNWLKHQKLTKAELELTLKNHIKKTLLHFKTNARGAVPYWDLANEVFAHNGTYRSDSFWAPIAPNAVELLDLAFRWAHSIDPTVKLFYNDYNFERAGKKQDAVYNTLKTLKERGVPVHGIGFQMHHGPKDQNDWEEVRMTMEKFAALDLEIHVTEYEFVLEDSMPQAKAYELQAKNYGNAITTCLQVRACKSFVTWGFTDKDSWVPISTPGRGRALYLDESYQPKPALFSIVEALSAPR